MAGDDVFIGFITATGLLTLDRKPAFATHLKSLAGQEVEVIVRKRKFVRSLAQNRYYWGVVIKELVEYTGYTADEMHDVLKMTFLPKHLVFTDNNGVVVGDAVVGGTTTKLSIQEFIDYCAAIQRWAAEKLNVQIPDPNEPFDNPLMPKSESDDEVM